MPLRIPDHARGYEGFTGAVGYTMAESSPVWPQPHMARRGSPNVVLVMIDDMGYSDIGAFGSEIPTPNLDRLARRGPAMTNYHTTPLCSPSRAALLTGINPHRAGFGHVSNSDPGYPGYSFELADDVKTVAEIFQDNGYATWALGKWHLSREALLNESAARGSWPCQRGFDRYYGCLEGFTSFFAPHRLYRDNTPVDIEDFPDDYYITDDLTNEAVRTIRGLRAHDAEKPFFMYFAHHAMHAPLGATEADMAAHRGRYDVGWDEIRRRRFARQKELGIFPADTLMIERNENEPRVAAPPWEDVPAEDRAREAALMEVYAGMVTSVDRSVGEIMDTLEALGELDNTLIVFTSDNGGSPEGGVDGTRSYFSQFISVAELPESWQRDVPIDPALIGGPRTMSHYSRGWAMASNTPFRLYKGYTYAGGVRTPLLMSWPAAGWQPGYRDQFLYVTDLLPTIVEALGLELSGHRRGTRTKEIDGVSYLPVLRDPAHDAVRTEQYSEMGSQRGFYKDGYKLLARHHPGQPFSDHEWQLFDVRSDPTELYDLCAQRPELARELMAGWDAAAWRNTVFPIFNGSMGPGSMGRPQLARLEDPVTLLPGTPLLDRYRSAKLVQLRSCEIVARFEWSPGDHGVLVSHGDQGGGYLLAVRDEQVHVAYNEYGLTDRTDVPGLVPGENQVSLHLEAQENFRWRVFVVVNGTTHEVGDYAMMLGFAPFTGISVGMDRGGPVDWEAHEQHRTWPYTGTLHAIRYVPGTPAAYDARRIAAAQDTAAELYD